MQYKHWSLDVQLGMDAALCLHDGAEPSKILSWAQGALYGFVIFPFAFSTFKQGVGIIRVASRPYRKIRYKQCDIG